MKRILSTLAVLSLLVGSSATALAAPARHQAPKPVVAVAVVHTQPSQCTGTYSTVIAPTNQDRGYVYGTTGNDLIYVGSGNYVYGLGGDDCVVLEGSRNIVDAGDGADVVVSQQGGDQVNGNTGNDQLYGASRDILDGSSGTDTCTGDRTVIKNNCEL